MHRMSDHPRSEAWFLETGFDSDDVTGPSSPTTESRTSGDASPTAELKDELAAFGASELVGFSCPEVTISVPVPTSDHVAEIVGKQGSKIKALRERTNTNIKTPSRDEPPVFIIEGRLEGVIEAQQEIERAAEHFTHIRGYGCPPTSLAALNVTALIRVPPGLAGLVVGPKGATIKRIQQDTGTIVVSPTSDQPPIFEVTGLPQDIEAARLEIEQHLLRRTGIVCSVELFVPSDRSTNVKRAIEPAYPVWPYLGSVGVKRGPLWSDACDYQLCFARASDGWKDFDRKSCVPRESAGCDDGSVREKSKLSEWLRLKATVSGVRANGSDDARVTSSTDGCSEESDRVKKTDGAVVLISPIWSDVDTFVAP
ncbi:MEX-3 protein [Aphelenchoides avenae]|nr:MEX-3 protein [Aphelenchus avenae]